MPKFIVEYRKKIYLLCTIVTLCFVFLFVPVSRISNNIFSVLILGPIEFVSNFSEIIKSKYDISNENKVLNACIAEFSMEKERYADLKDENNRLRDLLGFKRKVALQTIPAEVIARTPDSWTGSFLINKGFKDKINKDAAICSSSGLLGKVADVNKNNSTVMLLSHPAFRAGGMIKRNRINGVIVGIGNGRAKIIYLPVNADIKIGDDVFTSEYSRIFPKGIAIGKIITVGKSQTGLYKYGIIKPFADPFKQEEVLCVK